jgi:hypothetical protein
MTAAPQPVPRRSDQQANADYIASMAAEMAVLARRNGLKTLAYLLDMAEREARDAGTPE